MVTYQSRLDKLVIYGILIVGSLIMLYPFAFQVLASLGSVVDYSHASILPIPIHFNIHRYVTVFTDPKVYHLYFNTLLRCVYYIFLNCLCALVYAYVFSKLKFKGREIIFMIFLAAEMIPPVVTIIPTYIVYAHWPFAGGNNWLGSGGHGLINSWGWLFFPNILPIMLIFLMKQTLDSIPFDYEEAARIDGAGVFRVIFRIYLPLVVPVMAAIVIMTFVGVWNDYLGPLIYITDPNKQVIATGINDLMVSATQMGSIPNYPDIFALATVAIIPPILVYFWLQKYFVQGFAMIGIKG